MLIIEGKTRKSLAVSKYLSGLEESENVLIVDTENVMNKVITRHSTYYYIESSKDIDIIVGNFRDYFRENHEELKKFKFNTVIFYLNTLVENIQKVKALEKEFGFNAVLTIQSDKDCELKKYYV